jgi:hypothetical protein
MTKPWTREDTKDWLFQIHHRIEDIDYYLMRTVEWCEENGVYDDEKVLICSMMTVLWVSNMRQEPVTRRETLEILGIQGWDQIEDAEFMLGAQYQNYDLEQLLEELVKKF